MKRSFTRRGFMAGAAAGALTPLAGSEATGAPLGAEALALPRALSLDELNTPALLIDLDVMEANLRRMADHLRGTGVKLRPHTKTHKCPIIARKQMDLGAVGVCAAKVSEAEVMIDAGIGDVLITSPVVTPEKIERVVALAKKSAGLQMVIDNPKTADDTNEAAEAAGVVLPVLIGIDTGTARTGIAQGEPALDLVKRIAKLRNLRFDGIQAYAGHIMHMPSHSLRKNLSTKTLEKALGTKAEFEAAGFDVKVFSVGGTGTFDIDTEFEGVTDLQAGSYLFMDVQYRGVGDADSEVFDYFQPSLFVLLTAISQPVPGRITVDGGYKAFAAESVRPEFKDITGVDYRWGGDEHGILRFKNPSREIKVGDKFQMIASHCDPTVNLYDYYHPHRGGRVEELWPIAARGKSQ